MNGQIAVLNKSVSDNVVGGSGTTPHRRYHFSPGQTLELNQAFSLNPYPSVKDRQDLANRLGIDQKTVTTWFKNQRCRLPKMLRKQLLEINSNNRNGSLDPSTAPLITASLMSSLPLTSRLGSPSNTSTNGQPLSAAMLNEHTLGNGLATPFPQLAICGGDVDSIPDKGAYQEQIKNALAKLLSANQQSQYDLGSNGNTPEIPSGSVTSNSESSEINVKQEMDDIDVCRIDDTLEDKSESDTDEKKSISDNCAIMNILNSSRNPLVLGQKKKCSHLYPLFRKYSTIMSDDAKKYLILDFNLDNEFYKNPELTDDDDIRNIIVNEWLDHFPLWFKGQTGSGFKGLSSLTISDQIILNKLYKQELENRQTK